MTTEVLVYTAADEVVLLLEGRSLGTQPAGRAHDCTARFSVPYQPGELTAVAHRAGAEVGRGRLVTAGPDVRLRLRADRHELAADGQDLASSRWSSPTPTG